MWRAELQCPGLEWGKPARAEMGVHRVSPLGHWCWFPQFMGRWFSAGLASNSSWFREKKATMSMCSTVVALSADGGLNLTSTFLRWAGMRAGFREPLQGPENPARCHGLGTLST